MKTSGIITTIFSLVLLGGCNVTPPDNSSDAVMNLVFTRDNELWTYDLLSDHFENIVPRGSVVYTNDLGLEYTRQWADRAQWSPDGKKIVFVEAVGTDAQNLKILDITTGSQTFFNDTIFRQDLTPTWIQSGSEILFAKSTGSFGQDYEIFRVDLNSQAENKIVSRPRFSDYYPTINFSNNTIVFAGIDSLQAMQLYQVGVDGSNLTRLTYHGPDLNMRYYCPQFSPSNNDLVFVTMHGDSIYRDIWLVHELDFTNPIRLTHSDYIDWGPSWSNDGTYIVFTRYEDPFHAFDNPTVWIMNADGTDQRKLLENASNPDLWSKN